MPIPSRGSSFHLLFAFGALMACSPHATLAATPTTERVTYTNGKSCRFATLGLELKQDILSSNFQGHLEVRPRRTAVDGQDHKMQVTLARSDTGAPEPSDLDFSLGRVDGAEWEYTATILVDGLRARGARVVVDGSYLLVRISIPRSMQRDREALRRQLASARTVELSVMRGEQRIVNGTFDMPPLDAANAALRSVNWECPKR